MSCNKGDVMSKIHGNLRNLRTKMLSEVCVDAEIDQKLTLLMSKEVKCGMKNIIIIIIIIIINEAICDILH